MNVFVVSLLALAVAALATTVDAKCVHRSENTDEDHREIDFDDLTTRSDREDRNAHETNDVARKLRIVQTIGKKYPVYAEEAEQSVKFSDPLNLVDATESLPNGYIEYKNATISGVGNTVLKEVNFDRIENNKFSVFAVLSGADVNGEYIAGTLDGLLHSGQFQITLTDCEFRAQLGFDQFPELRPEIGSGSIACAGHGSSYSDDGPLLERLTTARESGAASAVPTPYHYYRDYLNGAIKSRLAEEMVVRLAPSIAKRLERKFAAAVLFPADAMRLPETRAYIAPGIQAKIYETQLEDLANTVTVQKLVNYTAVGGGATEMLFSFGAFDLTGSTGWTLVYDADGKSYGGRAAFAVDNLQAAIVARKPDGRGTSVKFAVTTVNGLTMTALGAGDQTCESIVKLAGQRVPKVLERGLEAYVGRYFESVLRNQIAIVGEQDQ